MQCVEIPLSGAFLIELEPKFDERGSFCRLFCQERLNEKIDEFSCMQINLSDNLKKGTLRGMHTQPPPYLEAKIVYCLRGKVFDVIVDLRENSPTYLQHFGMKLSEEDPCALYIPKGFAHGFLTLEEGCQMLYLMSDLYKPGYECGYRYDDPAFGIEWPFAPTLLSERDKNHPPFESCHAVC
jgi:dTDP-4-dehydrorhamnose 3,5-epimerase